MTQKKGKSEYFSPLQLAGTCPVCQKPMELTLKGPVCRNKSCPDFRHPYIIPHANPLQLKAMEHKQNKQTAINDQRSLPKKPITCCPKSFFDIKSFFESMEYLGSVKSRSNQYYCYEFDGVYMVSTDLKELTRFNAIRLKDLLIVENLIRKKHNADSFSAKDLRNTCICTKCDSPRINEIRQLELNGQAKHNDLYWLMFTSCNLLAGIGILTVEKQGHGIYFTLNEHQDLFLSGKSVYSDVKFLSNLNENTAAFEMGSFYLEIRCNGYRGSIVPYIKEEIEYLNELIEPLKPNHQLDISNLIDLMDYSHRFNRLYDLLSWRNIRNDRDEYEYFERRIKSALELVAKLKNTVKSDKEGRTKVFYKR